MDPSSTLNPCFFLHQSHLRKLSIADGDNHIILCDTIAIQVVKVAMKASSMVDVYGDKRSYGLGLVVQAPLPPYLFCRQAPCVKTSFMCNLHVAVSESSPPCHACAKHSCITMCPFESILLLPNGHIEERCKRD